MILGLDTATKTCGVALWNPETRRMVAQHSLSLTRHIHSTRLLPMITSLMSECGVGRGDIDRVAVTEGPGSFTGVRIGVTTAKTLAYAWNVPVVPVSTLDVLAAAINGPVCVAALMEARNHRVYTLVRDSAGRDRVGPGQWAISELAELINAASGLDNLWLVGSGAEAYGPELVGLVDDQRSVTIAPAERHQPDPAVLCRIAASRVPVHGQEHTLELVPQYLRRSSAERERANTEGGDIRGASTKQ